MRCGKTTAKEQCFHCGREAHASWHGNTESVHVCEACALGVLPALIADAVHVGPTGTVGFMHHLKAVECAYWKAVASRLACGSRDRDAEQRAKACRN